MGLAGQYNCGDMLLLCTLILAAYTTALVDGENGSCCESVTLSSGGMGDFYQGERLGHFVRSGSSSSGRAIYTQSEGTNHLFYLSTEGVWMVGPNVGQDFGGILNRESGECPESPSKTGNITGIGLTLGKKTGHWKHLVGIVDQHQTLMGSHVPGVHTAITVIFGMKQMVYDTAVLQTAILDLWM